MIITSVQIRDTKTETRLEGVASVTFDNMIVIHDIKIISNTEGGYFLAMPSRRLPNGTFKDIAHPISKEARGAVESVCIGLFEVMKRENAEIISFELSAGAAAASMVEQKAEDFAIRPVPAAE